MGHLQYSEPINEEKYLKRKHRKAVSFSSTATTSSYKTCTEPLDSNVQTAYRASLENATDTDSCWKSSNYDTDYYSPDEEDDDEFFDIVPTDDER